MAGVVDPRRGTLAVVEAVVVVERDLEVEMMGRRRWGRDEEARSVVVVVRWRPCTMGL